MLKSSNPFDTEYYYNENDLRSFGIGSVGKNVKIAKNCTIVGLDKISIGNNVTIDPLCSIIVAGHGHLTLGSYIHIGSFSFLVASEGIKIEDFSGLSQGVKIYSKTDDYSGKSLTNPTIPKNYRTVKKGKVILQPHVIIGAGSVVLPNVIIGEGVAIGALSLVTTNLDSWTIYAGNPLKKVFKRSQHLLKLKDDLLEN